MKLLEFMQPFDGTQPIVSEDEQREATDLFATLAQDALFAHPDDVSYKLPERLGDRLPLLRLFPLEADVEVTEARVALVHNPSSTNTHVHLDIPQAEGVAGLVSYSAERGGPVRRYDIPDIEASRRLKDEAVSHNQGADYTAENDANKALEQTVGVNGCPVGIQEIRELGRLLVRMMP